MSLSEADKRMLLTLAHRVISNRINSGSLHSENLPALPATLQVNCGVFVSLYVDEQLRGCIGTFSEENPLHRNVREMAVAAAFSDSRFDPITLSELAQLVIEISVLSPRERIYDKDEIVLGKHGIYMEHGINRGTLLPQVAISQNWTIDEYLGNCAKYKAGIGWNGWRSALLYTYEAIIFKTNQV